MLRLSRSQRGLKAKGFKLFVASIATLRLLSRDGMKKREKTGERAYLKAGPRGNWRLKSRQPSDHSDYVKGTHSLFRRNNIENNL